ncbi:hypothetical protein K435DRAFT_962623 [Dendrothele bispora CBS 962.96]|uniref:Mid2 domain-containing protein n=1 Tax=Dendrothele bispora (strain CBS 962.96) TaxID=1314807 RepID=A0A4S8MJV3_DENBC|nr:hypothetical protein K435DRAFT_962623 [Dendrothele bispora CBS 962.96]
MWLAVFVVWTVAFQTNFQVTLAQAFGGLSIQGNAQCGQTTISWQGSNPPYTIGIVQNRTSSENPSFPQVIYRNFSQNSLTFRLFYPEGTNLRISVAQEDPNVPYSPIADNLAVAAGTNANCFTQATTVQSQTPVANSTNTDVPQCGSLQANVSGSVIYINSGAQYTDKNLIATSPSTIMYNIGNGSLATFNISLPYPEGTPLFFQSGDVPGGFNAPLNIESSGNNSCLLADPSFNSATSGTNTSPIPTSTNPQDDVDNKGSSRAGTIIPAVVVPIVVLLLAGIAAIFFFRRRRDQRRRFRDSQSLSHHHRQTSQVLVPYNANQYTQNQPSLPAPHGLVIEPFSYNNHSRSNPVQFGNVASTHSGNTSDITSRSQKSRLAYGRRTEPDPNSGMSDFQDGRSGIESPTSASASDPSTSDRMHYVRHQDAGPYRVTELPPLYQDLTIGNDVYWEKDAM